MADFCLIHVQDAVGVSLDVTGRLKKEALALTRYILLNEAVMQPALLLWLQILSS